MGSERMAGAAWIAGSAAYQAAGPGPVLTIGNFDGVHLGHQALIARTREEAARLGVRAAAYTFDPAPRDVLRPDNGVLRVQSLADKVALMLDHGLDQVVVEPFDLAFAAQSAEAFATQILVGRLAVSALVVGWDFRFGRGREGTVEGLSRLLPCPVLQVAPVELDGVTVSSSAVREAVTRGEVAVAARLLGRPHALVGRVVHGEARGRLLGFPTANIEVETPLLPAYGVYAVRVERGGQVLDGMANLGLRPTFHGERPSLEVHLFDFEGDLYEQSLRVSLIARLREERRFDGPKALVVQLERDREAARLALRQG